MTKNFYLLIGLWIFVCLVSCKAMKFSHAESVNTNNGNEKIELVKNQVLINTQIEGREQSLALDLGAMVSVLYDTAVIKDFYTREKSTFGSAKGAGSGKIKITQLPLTLNDSLFSSQNKVFTVINNDALLNKDKCSTVKKLSGVYGADLFKKNKAILLIDIEEKKLCNLTDSVLTSIIQTGFTEIKSTFGMKIITVYVNIDGKEYPFGFDTGFTGSFTMPYSEDIDFLKDTHISMEGMQAITITGIQKGTSDVYEEKKIAIGATDFVTMISVSTGIKSQNMGMGFMKGFNWVIDYKHKKIYFKKIAEQQDSKLDSVNNYNARIVKNKLIVASRKVNMTEYNIGDEIISVNGQAVNDTNKCEMLQLLAKSTDWKTVNVITLAVVEN
ncbi:MAG: hypothetical protein ABI402_05335 [Ferruginibacter sp.]